MYRDDRNAMVHQLDSVTREAEALRGENAAMREQLLALQRGASQRPIELAYVRDVSALSRGERAALAHHSLTAFPVWAAGLLHFLTLGIFSIIHFGLAHDRLPKAAHNDPGAGESIGYSFIPVFAWYWIFFNSMRLADRLDLQLRLRDRPPAAPKGLMIASCILSVHPLLYLFLGWPILWLINSFLLQYTINQVAALGPVLDPAASESPALDPYAQPPAGLITG